MTAAVQQALILVGGRGNRLGGLTETCPKPLLQVGGTPFLHYLIWLLGQHGVRKIVLSTGYRSEMFRTVVPTESTADREVIHSIETEPLGTGGAIALAKAHLDESFLVLNGDTIFDIDHQVLAMTLKKVPGAVASVALRHVDDTSRYGRVVLDGERVRSFSEKTASGPGWINGGIYCLKREALGLLPKSPASVERDLFPRLAQNGQLAGHAFDGYFIDIGLPDTLARAQTELPAWRRTVESRAARSNPLAPTQRR